RQRGRLPQDRQRRAAEHADPFGQQCGAEGPAADRAEDLPGSSAARRAAREFAEVIGRGPSSLGCALAGAALLAFSVAPAHAEAIRAEISKLLFMPGQISAHVGDTIEWVNADIVAHTATAKSKDFDVMIPPKQTTRQVLNKPGAFDIFCRFHP